MDWFWNRKKKRKSGRKGGRKPKQKRGPSAIAQWRQKWDPHLTWQSLRACTAVGLVLAIVWGWINCKSALMDYATEQRMIEANREIIEAHRDPDIPIPPARPTIELADAPQWLDQSDQPQGLKPAIQALVAQHIGNDPMNRDDLDKAHAALERCAWIKRADRIERVTPDHIRVHAEYREPFAAIRDGKDESKFFLVDIEGVRLLRAPYSRQQVTAQGFAVITGAAAPATAVGAAWPGEDVVAGLSVARLLRDRPYFGEIREIDVSNASRDGRTRVVIHSRHDGRVDWGFAPGNERGSEIAAKEKRFALDQLYYQRQTIFVPRKTIEFNGRAVFANERY